MNKKVLCIFSSNSRPLYIGDIYKILSMPRGYIVHFRYKKKYIEPKLLDDLNRYKERKVIIFFNDNKNNVNYSVRSAKLKLVEKIDETELIHVYMELENFINAQIPKNTDPLKLPEKIYFSELELKLENENVSWKSKIDELKNFFPRLSFFYLKGIRKNPSYSWIKNLFNLQLIMKSHNDNKSSYFTLKHGNKYLLDISLGNPNEVKCEIGISTSSEDVSFNVSNPISITANYDDLSVPMYLKSLNVSNESSFLSFFPEVHKNENETSVEALSIKEYTSNIEIDKNISIRKSISYGLASVVVVSSIWLIKDNSSYLKIDFDLPINFTLIFSCISLIVASSYLFYRFDKK